MSRTRHMARVTGALPLFAAALMLASCGAMPLGSLFSRPQPLPARPVIAPSAEAREVSVAEPTLSLPMAADPQAPQVASNVPRRPLRPPTPAMKPAPPPQIEAVAPGDLVGSDFSSVLQVLRQPDSVQNSALSVVWTYETDCKVQLYFYPDIKTRVFRLLKYDLKDSSGEKPMNSNACMRSIMVAKSDEPASP